ncbi:nucleoporin NUP53 [Striga asiatica]|uniref:CASP-like protein n=1 Tax=Striga asiatica TaxID=4170 RepID=A0A5A7R5B4_STRAF|nr:nucleoporin NUP53 [Striga asiatica]
MGTNVHRTPKSGGRSLFFQDLASPVTSRKSGGKFSTPGQAAAVSALWRENFANSDLPPPPVFTLEDRYDLSPESGIPDYPLSPEAKSDPKTPLRSLSREFSTPKSKSDASTSYAGTSKQQLQSPMASSSWWSPAKSGGSGGGIPAEQEEKGRGSPVEGVVQPGALITLPPPREVARPEVKRSLVPVGNLDEEDFSPADTNLVLREFEKCGVILKHVPGPRDANWMHVLYQNRSDAQKALGKNGMEINGVLIIGVKPVDPMQRHALNERIKSNGFMTSLPPQPSSRNSESNGFKVNPYPYYLQNRSSSVRQPAGTMATPAKSMVSKIADLMYLVGVSAVVTVHSLIQLIINMSKILRKSPIITSRNHAWLIFVADQIFGYAMMSAGSAASGVTNLNRTGIHHSALPNFCKPLRVFCDRVAVSIAFAFFSCFLLAISVVLDVIWLSMY